MKITTRAATGLSLVIVFFLCIVTTTAQVRPGGGRVQKASEKTHEKSPTAKPGNKKTIDDKTPSDDSVHEPPIEQAGTIEIWVDNQSLHASDRNIGSPESPLRSITAAVRKAVREVGDGDALIRVMPGTYRESVEVPPYEGKGRIIIRGENVEATIISGGELLSYWQPRTNPLGGGIFFAHEDVFPEGEKTGAFYADTARQKKSLAEQPGPGEFVLKNGEILWMPPPDLDWQHAEITAPVRPYPAENSNTALVAISGGRVRMESLTLRHCALADAVVVVNGAEEVAFYNLRLSDNEAPGFLIFGLASAEARCNVLVDKVKIFGAKTPFFSTRDADFTLRESILEFGAKKPGQEAPGNSPSPLIKTDGNGVVHISKCLLASNREELWLNFSGLQKTILQSNTLIQSDGRARLELPAGDFLLLQNFFLSESDEARGLTLLQVPVAGRDSAASCQDNVFQSNLAMLLLVGIPDHAAAKAHAAQPYARWKFTGNCVAPGAEIRVIHTNCSIFGTVLSQRPTTLANALRATKKCDERLIAQAASSAQEKLRLSRD